MKEKKITLDGIEFIINKLPALTALRLDKKVIQIILPALGGLSSLKNVDLDSDVKDLVKTFDFSKIGNIFQIFSECLMSLKDDEYMDFLNSMLQTTQAIKFGVGAVELSDADALSRLDVAPMTIYKLLYEVMKFNKFSPFELVAGGNGITGTGFLAGLNVSEPVTSQDSEMSEN